MFNVISFLERQRRMRYRYNDDISKTIVMQRWISERPLDLGFVARSSGVAPRRWGIVIPIVALALLGADIAILAGTVAQ